MLHWAMKEVNPQPSTRNPQPSPTLNSQHSTLNPHLSTLQPLPFTQEASSALSGGHHASPPHHADTHQGIPAEEVHPSSTHGARPVHLIITMIKWIPTSRLK